MVVPISLITVGTGISGGSAGVVPKTVRVQLPDRFKNKEFRVICRLLIPKVEKLRI